MDKKMIVSEVDFYFDRFFELLLVINRKKLLDIALLLVKSRVIVCCGNGGSYSVATHIAGDLLINTKIKANTIAIGDNTVALTACSNDYNYETALAIELERRMCTTTGLKTIILISTSGKSKNILNVGRKAKEIGFHVVSLVGKDPSCVEEFSDIVLSLDSKDPGFLEVAFDFVGHILIKIVRGLLDEDIFNKSSK